jgi:tubulin-folding cofactor B
VQVTVTHSNLNQRVLELRLSLHSTIMAVKLKLQSHNGTSPEYMVLQLQDASGAPICRMLDDDKPLGYYGVQNGHTIHVIDSDPYSLSRGGGLDDVSQVEKYRMADEDYDKRENTLRAYKKKMMAADPTFRLLPQNRAIAEKVEAYKKPEVIEGIKVGDRCSIIAGDRRGTVAYIGEVPALLGGYWVGIVLDEPTGKGTGVRGDVKYFDAPEKYAGFVRPDNIAVGDFPVKDDFGLDDDAADDCGGCCDHEGHGTGEEECKTTGEEKEEAAIAIAPKGAPAAPTATSTTTTASVAINAKPMKASVGGMVRKGGRRADEENDDDDDEL